MVEICPQVCPPNSPNAFGCPPCGNGASIDYGAWLIIALAAFALVMVLRFGNKDD